jgi:FlaA1/EpsC-like NDP-sugar epimerase
VVPADVTNVAKMDLIFEEYQPDVVFHAAAYKHVSLMEENPHEAIRINVGGTKVLTDLALKYKVGKFVMISTDKSVNPSSVMGASKRICEKIVQSKAQTAGHKTQFIITRFGNVLGSNGSVIPLFTRQIENGGPVTVTHPDIYRYFMTIPEACQLVLEAGFMGNGGDIYVFDMGQQVKIAELAKTMIQLSGLIPGRDIQIVYTGLRPGEKLYEELLTDKENTIPTHHKKIKKAHVEMIDSAIVISKIDDLLNNLYSFSKEEVVNKMRDLVPEYKSSNGSYKEKSAELSAESSELTNKE